MIVQVSNRPRSTEEGYDSEDSDVSSIGSVDNDSFTDTNRAFRSQKEICEQLNINHMLQRIFLITLDNSEYQACLSCMDNLKLMIQWQNNNIYKMFNPSTQKSIPCCCLHLCKAASLLLNWEYF